MGATLDVLPEERIVESSIIFLQNLNTLQTHRSNKTTPGHTETHGLGYWNMCNVGRTLITRLCIFIIETQFLKKIFYCINNTFRALKAIYIMSVLVHLIHSVRPPPSTAGDGEKVSPPG